MRIYVGNLPYESTEEDLTEAFSAHGEVESVTVIRDRDTGRSKGFAFVEMPTNVEAQAAIAAFNGQEYNRRTLTVNEARPRAERGFGDGGGGGGGYGGGGGGGGYGGSGGGGGRWTVAVAEVLAGSQSQPPSDAAEEIYWSPPPYGR